MKKIFALATVLVSMTAALTSCGNGEADHVINPAPKPDSEKTTPADTSDKEAAKITFDGTLYFTAGDNQLDCINCSYDIQVGGKTLTVNLADLQPTTNYPDGVKMALTALELNTGFKPVVLTYQIPSDLKGEVKITYNWSMKIGVNLPEKVSYIYGVITNNPGTASSDFHSSTVKAEKLQKQLERLNTRTALNAIIQ